MADAAAGAREDDRLSLYQLGHEGLLPLM